jgi:hypothetical protein
VDYLIDCGLNFKHKLCSGTCSHHGETPRWCHPGFSSGAAPGGFRPAYSPFRLSDPGLQARARGARLALALADPQRMLALLNLVTCSCCLLSLLYLCVFLTIACQVVLCCAIDIQPVGSGVLERSVPLEMVRASVRSCSSSACSAPGLSGTKCPLVSSSPSPPSYVWSPLARQSPAGLW